MIFLLIVLVAVGLTVINRLTNRDKKAVRPPRNKKKWSKKTWRILGIIAAIILVLYVIVSLLVYPRIMAWVRAKYPEAFAVQKRLEAQYPQDKIGVYDQTIFNAGDQQHKARVLVVNIIGGRILGIDEKNKAERTICSALGQNAHKYSSLVLESTIEHRFLIFTSQQGKSETFSCQ